MPEFKNSVQTRIHAAVTHILIEEQQPYTLRQVIDAAESAAVHDTLVQQKGLVRHSADALGIYHKTLRLMMNRYGFKREVYHAVR